MRDRRLDDVARAIAVGSASRRGVVKAIAVVLAAFVSADRASAVVLCKAADRRCILDADCCSNRCRRGRCKGGGTCLPNVELAEGACEAGVVCCSRTCQKTFIDDACGIGERCCELANQPEKSIRGRCTVNRDCCSCTCVEGRCRTNVG